MKKRTFKVRFFYGYMDLSPFTYICFANIGCGSAEANENVVFSLPLLSPFAIFVNHRMRVVFAMSVCYGCDMKNKPFDI